MPTRTSDRIIYELRNGHMVRLRPPLGPLFRDNFVIVSHHGKHDWSGFRTLVKCEAQFGELTSKGKPDGYYQVVER